ncbi:MAG: hypothetical protein JNN15_20105, partial [Blastocatellia bacterium]|nr:hypothetical protein [Blastocatellia bacterium]
MDNRGFQEQTFRLKKVSPSNQTFKLKQVKPYKAPKWPSYLFYGSIILGVSSVVGLSLFES